MKTLYIANARMQKGSMAWGSRYKDPFEQKYPIGVDVLIIGVQGTYDSVDAFLSAFPEFEMVRKFPTVVNSNYIGERNSHTLETCFVRRIK